MGRVVLLNGVSSSGKSSVAKVLHRALVCPPWMLLELDDFLSKLPLDSIQSKEDFVEIVPKVISGFHGSIAEFSKSGVDCIVDHVFQEAGWFDDFLAKVSRDELVLVGLSCPLEVLEKREKARGDRQPGLAKSQYEKVHQGIDYHLEIDTNRNTPEQSASLIIEHIRNL